MTHAASHGIIISVAHSMVNTSSYEEFHAVWYESFVDYVNNNIYDLFDLVRRFEPALANADERYVLERGGCSA